MIGDYFEGVQAEQFEKWLKRIAGLDDRYKHLLLPEYEEERQAFYNYFERGLSPWQTLQEEYQQYG